MEVLAVYLKESTLRKFLAISRILRSHARIRGISLPNLDAYDEAGSDCNLEDGGAAQELKSPSSMVDAKPHQEMEQMETGREIEISDEPQKLGDIKKLLLQVFRVLNAAPNLEMLRLSPNFGFDLVLSALVAARFIRNVVNLIVDPFFLTTVGSQSQQNSPHAFSPHVRGLLLSTPIFHDGYMAGGSHYRGFRPITPQLNHLIQALTALDCLEIEVCRPNPELRLCHGCDNLFARNFAPMRYPHLSKPRIESFLISGGRLRAFIKRYAKSLRNVEFEFVTLTDGSWRSVAQGLSKLSFITKLDLAHLHQKHPSDHRDQSRD